jgi:hypothetical protein
MDIENITKSELFSGLPDATVSCKKGGYSKGDHAFDILARIDPGKVRIASPVWVERLLLTLDRTC